MRALSGIKGNLFDALQLDIVGPSAFTRKPHGSADPKDLRGAIFLLPTVADAWQHYDPTSSDKLIRPQNPRAFPLMTHSSRGINVLVPAARCDVQGSVRRGEYLLTRPSEVFFGTFVMETESEGRFVICLVFGQAAERVSGW
jgi:hypothetical protein